MAEQPVPYRRMPGRYIAIWIGLGALAAINSAVQTGEWPPNNITRVVNLTVGGVLGGLLWGWLLWRFWLYRKLTKL